MMTFYAAAGSYQIRSEDGKNMPYIMRLGKLQPVSIPEFSLWSMLLWDVAFIHTDQSCFLSTHLFDQGYRIFLHFKSGTVTEVGRGENPALPVRIIRENMNLEAPLLAGLLGKLTE